MHLSILIVVISSFNAHSSPTSPNPLPLILPYPEGSNDSLPVFHNLSSLDTGTSRTYCSAQQYGSNLSWDSCVQAWEKMPQSSMQQTYVARTQNRRNGIRLPLRYLSDDAACAITINQKKKANPGNVDVSTDSEIAGAAVEVLERCVKESKLGGYVTNFCKR